jgi:hypothetical protein
MLNVSRLFDTSNCRNTLYLIEASDRYITEKYVNGDNCIQRQIVARVAYFAAAIFCTIWAAVEVVIGAVAGVVTILSLTLWSAPLKLFNARMYSVRYLISYELFLKTINPNVTPIEQVDFGNNIVQGGMHFWGGAGFVKWTEATDTGAGGFLKRQVISRLAFLCLLLPTFILCRGIEGGRGIIAGVASIICLGKVDSFNRIAKDGMTFPVIIHDVFFCVISFVNPKARVSFNSGFRRMKVLHCGKNFRLSPPGTVIRVAHAQ